jgi:tyrosine-protein kinase Etk/Wzc
VLLTRTRGERFDTVIVDAPPVLAVSDAAIIGRHVGATLMVAARASTRFANSSRRSSASIRPASQVKGFVFNDLNVSRQRYRYGYKGYVYRYSYKT